MNKKHTLRCIAKIIFGVTALYAVNILICDKVMSSIDTPLMLWIHAFMVAALLLTTIYDLLIYSIILLYKLIPFGKRFLVNLVNED